jgi:hypothetical protein
LLDQIHPAASATAPMHVSVRSISAPHSNCAIRVTAIARGSGGSYPSVEALEGEERGGGGPEGEDELKVAFELAHGIDGEAVEIAAEDRRRG